MPQDSVYYEMYTTGGDTIRLPFKDSATMQAWADQPDIDTGPEAQLPAENGPGTQAWTEQLATSMPLEEAAPGRSTGVWSWIFMGLFLLMMFSPLLTQYLPGLFRWPWLRSRIFRNRDKEAGIAAFLQANFLYYRLLATEADKEKFVQRVYRFQRHKEFHFTGMHPSDEARYLVSAAAVQLTFGLDEFLLRSFNDIHIMPQDYRHLMFDKPLEGHITYGNIYFSWSHFKAGYAVPDNMHNVGLHEMAHALAYECFNTGGGGDRHFKNYFYRYSAVARPIFNAMLQGMPAMLGSYACYNYDEFWAVSVEAFFEQPQLMRRELPELYQVMCGLLRQDTAAMLQQSPQAA